MAEAILNGENNAAATIRTVQTTFRRLRSQLKRIHSGIETGPVHRFVKTIEFQCTKLEGTIYRANCELRNSENFTGVLSAPTFDDVSSAVAMARKTICEFLVKDDSQHTDTTAIRELLSNLPQCI